MAVSRDELSATLVAYAIKNPPPGAPLYWYDLYLDKNPKGSEPGHIGRQSRFTWLTENTKREFESVTRLCNSLVDVFNKADVYAGSASSMPLALNLLKNAADEFHFEAEKFLNSQNRRQRQLKLSADPIPVPDKILTVSAGNVLSGTSHHPASPEEFEGVMKKLEAGKQNLLVLPPLNVRLNDIERLLIKCHDCLANSANPESRMQYDNTLRDALSLADEVMIDCSFVSEVTSKSIKKLDMYANPMQQDYRSYVDSGKADPPILVVNYEDLKRLVYSPSDDD